MRAAIAAAVLTLTTATLPLQAAVADDASTDPVAPPVEPTHSPWPGPVVTLPPVLEPTPPAETPPAPIETAPPVAPPAPIETPAPAEPIAPAGPVQPVPVATPEVAIPETSAYPPPQVVQIPDVAEVPVEPAPVATESAAVVPAAPTPSATPTQQPRVDAVQAAVSAATGSPLVVQILMVAFLIASGFAYFRAIGSKGMRVPTRSVK